MKKILLALCVVCFTGCSASLTQTKKPTPDVSNIIVINGKSKNKIFEESKIWIAKSFKSANSVIQYSDKETGSIIGKGTIKYPCDGVIDCGAFGEDIVNFTIKIDVKENKARVVFSDITRTPLTYVKEGFNSSNGREMPIYIVQYQQKVVKKLNEISHSYESELNSKVNNSDW